MSDMSAELDFPFIPSDFIIDSNEGSETSRGAQEVNCRFLVGVRDETGGLC